ncbi:uncharacterized protein HMPREF1541_10662 [Cyphellophora europaea CBS 101466]|uniref:AcnD-accessory protein PrpF n=1 Tax=Cyphellophora europaea (strain CBS 101466) TaxID=1220924 RepID=W2S5Z0_CYPE1|nr:uncharacterized protein HMPREF1541_10662 [Cyphellophora europaea CBS 101466]ETN44112.1 hypothetical protein HMPREF1541_10662 [Cyphellophora europaea CBS 101466]
MQDHLASLLGSPDPYGRQLDGLGGGISSLSKADLMDGPFADIQYTFFQVGVTDGLLDMSGNCGNLTSAVGPAAIDAGLLDAHLEDPRTRVTFRLLNLNTNQVIQSTFSVSRPESQPGAPWRFEPRGNFTMPGVAGTGSEITLRWLSPGGSKTTAALPTGRPLDQVEVEGQNYNVSLVDVSNPGIFISGADLGWDPARNPDELDAQPNLMEKLEVIRRKGAAMMGLDPDKPSIPKIVLVYRPRSAETHIDCQALSMGKAHKAVPGTLALNLGAACQMPGSVPNQLARASTTNKISIGHPTGFAEVGAKVTNGQEVEYVEISRTARCLMEGVALAAPSNYQCTPIPQGQMAE